MTEPHIRGELLLELLSEEIPADMQAPALAELTRLLRDKLIAAQIPATNIHGYVTPRRLVVIAGGIPSTQLDRTEERRGPRVGAPGAAIEGFLRSAGLAAIAECDIRNTGRGEFYFAVVKLRGRPAAEVLPDLIMTAITELPWPKSMRYPASSLRWVRPLNSVICLFEREVLPLSLGEVPVGRVTRGHRFLSPDEICVGSGAEYLEALRAAHVTLDQQHRKETIRRDLEKAAAAEGVALKPNPGLLDEVTGLVEYPVVLSGAIDAEFMALPPEVLATVMRTHQRYFSCLRPDGTPAPRFLFVADNLAADGGKTIVVGNERVLRARLDDARFFWDEDHKARLEDRVEALKQRVFHAKLGSLRDKVERLERIADFLVQYVPYADAARSRRAVRLAKADLSTGMVGEFPELQGIMGRYYALHDGEDPAVANAIADHYRPLGPNDACPSAPESVVAALADKIDSLVAFFVIGERSTGSSDPFALRRAAQGIIRIILENNLRVPLSSVFSYSNVLVLRIGSLGERQSGSILDELLPFIGDRLKVHLRDQGIRHDLIDAAFAKIREDNGDLIRLLNRVDALHAFLETEDGASLLTAYRRAANIVAIEERRDATRYDENPNSDLFEKSEEQALNVGLGEIGGAAADLLNHDKFEAAMSELARLRRPVDEFFNNVTVNVGEQKLRANRLRLLSRIRATMNEVADFSRIEG